MPGLRMPIGAILPKACGGAQPRKMTLIRIGGADSAGMFRFAQHDASKRKDQLIHVIVRASVPLVGTV
jgi:hypothetical protein